MNKTFLPLPKNIIILFRHFLHKQQNSSDFILYVLYFARLELVIALKKIKQKNKIYFENLLSKKFT